MAQNEQENTDTNEWFVEYFMNESHSLGLKINKRLHTEESQYQKIEVLDTESVGRLLLLDGCTMVSEADEFVYHEVMAHIPYMISRKCEKVLIIGGGDGGIVREFVKHKDIKQIDLVEIDQRVIDVSREYFPQVTSGLDDSRVNIHTVCGMQFIESKENEYDIIVVDSTDPKDFASALFTDEFYKKVNKALTAEGIMMNQTENPFLDQFGIKKIYDNLRSAFDAVYSFTAPMIIYPGVFWTFGFSSKKFAPTDFNSDKIQAMEEIQKDLKWYNMDWHKAAFSLSNFHKRKIGLM